jgi:hypothetical protein
MIEITGDIFRPKTYRPNIGIPSAICITTNGAVTKKGLAIMGRGVAKLAAELFPEVPETLGKLLYKNGNIVQAIRFNPRTDTYVLAFPTKPKEVKLVSVDQLTDYFRRQGRYQVDDIVPGWALKSTIDLIQKSTEQLLEVSKELQLKKVVIPRPGCSNGGLRWEEVKEVVSHLDDRFFVINLPPRQKKG